MATLSKEEINELMVQLKEKTEEIKGIYNKLIDAGVVPLSDDFLDLVSGGFKSPQIVCHQSSAPLDGLFPKSNSNKDRP